MVGVCQVYRKEWELNGSKVILYLAYLFAVFKDNYAFCEQLFFPVCPNLGYRGYRGMCSHVCG